MDATDIAPGEFIGIIRGFINPEVTMPTPSTSVFARMRAWLSANPVKSLAVGGFAAIGVIWLIQAQRTQQFHPPIPMLGEPPVVKSLPQIIQSVETNRDFVESTAAEAKRYAKAGVIREADMVTGRAKFEKARLLGNAVPGLVDKMIDRLFVDSDGERIAESAADAREAGSDFSQWLASVTQPRFTEGPLPPWLQMLKDFIADSNTANEAEKRMWKQKLEAAKIREWGNIPASKPDDFGTLPPKS